MHRQLRKTCRFFYGFNFTGALIDKSVKETNLMRFFSIDRLTFKYHPPRRGQPYPRR